MTQEQIIQKVVSPPTKSKEERAEELNDFKENIHLLLASSSKIKENPEYYYVTIDSIHIGLAYLGVYHIPLGVLLEIWDQGLLTDICKHCSGTLYLYNAAGSPLSGSNKCFGICLECEDEVSISLNTSGPLVQALQYVKKRQNLQKVIVTKRQYFSFAKGLDGEPDIEEVLSDGVTPVTIFQLIQQVNY